MIDINQIKGPEDYGAKLYINQLISFDPQKPVALDIETNEKDILVGLAMTQDGENIYYYHSDKWSLALADILGSAKYIMQGGAFDIRMLKKWGVNVSYENLIFDTKILAYVYDSTLSSYSLKKLKKGKRVGLAQMFLPQYQWSTYEEMVKNGKQKITLDQQSIERVSNYCGMDTMVEYKLYEYFWKRMGTQQKKYFNEIEMPLYRLLAKMEDKGLYLDVEYLKQLDQEFKGLIDFWEIALAKYGKFNPRSPKQLLEVFRKNNLEIGSTDSRILKAYKNRPLVKELLEYRKYKKLKSTYTEPFLKAETLPYIHTQLHQNTLTGRLSSSHPNLQNVPAPDPEHKRFHDDVGTKIRKTFTASPNSRLLVLDYNQIEYRLFAHFTQDPVLLDIYKTGKDIHTTTAEIVGYPDDRRLGKTLNFASIYGAYPKRIAQIANITEEKAREVFNAYWAKLSKASLWVTTEKYKARKNGGVETILGRFIPLEELRSKNQFERWHWERVAINAIIQGSAADIIKLAMLNIDKFNFDLRLQVHDELMLYMGQDDDGEMAATVQREMENVGKQLNLSVPLTVGGGYGSNWATAK